LLDLGAHFPKEIGLAGFIPSLSAALHDPRLEAFLKFRGKLDQPLRPRRQQCSRQMFERRA
jgi:hypothetical protein